MVDSYSIISPDEVSEESLSWLGLNSIPENIYNPLDNVVFDSNDPFREMVSLVCSSDYLHFTVRSILNVNLAPFQCIILDSMFTKRLPLVVASRGAGKTFMLSVFILLKLLLHQGTKIVVVGSAFRQSKNVFDYVCSIYDKAPILKSLLTTRSKTSKDGPKRDLDRCEFRIGDSTAVFIPLGDGTKIRGLRANCIIADEFACTGYNTLVETDKGLMRIGECDYRKVKLNNENGDYEKPIDFVKTPKTDVYKIKTKYGYSFKCSKIHKVKTSNGWKLGKDLTNKDYLIFENKYKFPKENVLVDNLEIDERIGWLFGLLTSEGTLTDENYINITTTDYNLVLEFLDKFSDYNVKVYTREESIDPRGWSNKKRYDIRINDRSLREKLANAGLKYCTCHEKNIPWSILQSPKSVVISFLEGMIIGDGSVFKWKDRNVDRLGIGYYSVSETLIDDLQVILQKLNILCYKNSRSSKLSKNQQWFIRLNGAYAEDLLKLLNRKEWLDISSECKIYRKRKDYGITFIKDMGKWRASILYCGQNKTLGYYSEKEEARNAVKEFLDNNPKCLQVKDVQLLEDQEHLYDFSLPETHSFYGSCFVQHNSIGEEIFNLVVQGFGIVSQDPIDKIKENALVEQLKKEGLWTEDMQRLYDIKNQGNQIIYSGTAYYAFNHFAKHWDKWHKIISSKGDKNKLANIFDSEDSKAMKGFNWRDYAIVRIPHTEIPHGFLDPGILAQAKATLSNSQFLMEYGACFPSDSEGFYKRSVIEAAVTNKPIITPSGKAVQFSSKREGERDRRYLMGIDPAADEDNAAIVIIEDHVDHGRIVYCWTTNRKKYRKYKKYLESTGRTIGDNYYQYIARKIRDLMAVFPIAQIVMDKHGGGTAVAEALSTDMEHDEQPILEVIDKDDPKDTDYLDGLHILNLLKPTSELNSEANHGMLKDIQDKTLLFPMFDTVEIERALITDTDEKIGFDTYEDLVYEIEDLKNEMTNIVCTPSSVLGREKFDTPEIKSTSPYAKKGRMRKDRYSALLYVNYLRRLLKNESPTVQYVPSGGVRGVTTFRGGTEDQMYLNLKSGRSTNIKTSTPGYIKRK